MALFCSCGVRAVFLLATASATPAALAMAVTDHLDLGGAVRLRFDHDPDRDIEKAGLDVVMLNGAYDDGRWMGAARYRWYGGAHPYQYTRFGGVRFLEYGWAGLHLDDTQQIKVGLHNVPFGLQPLFSSTFYETLGNVIGLEDLNQVGASWQRIGPDWNLQAGLYARPAWAGHGTGNGTTYAVTVTPADPGVAGGTRNVERDLVALRLARTLHVGEGTGELGVSFLHSTLHNRDTGRDGERRSAAVHYRHQQGRWDTRALLARQLMTPRNPDGSQHVTFGAYDGTFNVASRGTLGVLDLSYSVPGRWLHGWVGNVRPYVNYSRFAKSEAGARTSERAFLGVSASVRALQVALEWMHGRNDPYIGGSSYTQSLAEGGIDRWKSQLYMNIGYYF